MDHFRTVPPLFPLSVGVVCDAKIRELHCWWCNSLERVKLIGLVVFGDFLDFEMFEEFSVGDEGEVQAMDILRG